MKRSTPLKRTAFARKEPSFARSERPQAKEPKPAKAPKERKCSAPNCEATFIPKRMEHVVCSPRCLIAKRKADEKAERESFKVRKEKLKTVSEWEQECRAIVQKIARIRDGGDGCISCHVGPNYAGQWHGSHFRSVGACSALQFHLWNIHKSCAQCNLHKSGNIAAYRPRLVEKIGQDRVDWLESQNQVNPRRGAEYVEYLKRFKKVMGKRLRRMEKNKQ